MPKIDLSEYPSVDITEASMKQQMRRLLDSQAASINKNIAFSDEDFAALKAARKSAVKMVEESYAAMVETFETRRKNLDRFSHLEFVSLGFDCLPRALLTRWGMKKPRKLGELTHPFDTSIHPVAATRHLIETEFADYMSGLSYSQEDDFPHREDLGIRFNHEIGTEWQEDDFAKLKETYQRRTDNFVQTYQFEKPTVYIAHTHEGDEETLSHVVATFQRIREHREGRPTRFVWLYTPEFSKEWDSDVARQRPSLGEDIDVITEQYPFAGYIWYKPNHSFSRRGFRFEKRVIKLLQNAIKSASLNQSDV